MIGIAILSLITWQMRYYETSEVDIQFDTSNGGLVNPESLLISNKKQQPQVQSTPVNSAIDKNLIDRLVGDPQFKLVDQRRLSQN